MESEYSLMPHKLVLDERSRLTVTGVEEVVSFDDAAVILKTQLGTLVIQGRNLQLKALMPDGGQVGVEGTVCALSYEEPQRSGNWVRRLFG